MQESSSDVSQNAAIYDATRDLFAEFWYLPDHAYQDPLAAT
jgi:hypothetical protein